MFVGASVMTSSVSQASQLSGVWDYAALIDDPDHASSQNEAPAHGQAQTQTQNQTTSVVHTRSEAKTQGQGQQGKGKEAHPHGNTGRKMTSEHA